MKVTTVPSNWNARLRPHRAFRASLIATALALLGSDTPVRAEVARKADSFVDSIGINTHFKVSAPYSLLATSPHVSRLVESGIRYVRNNRIDVPELYTAGGIKTLVAIDANVSTTSVVSMLAKTHVIGVEGFNEPDAFPKPGENWAIGDYNYTRAYQQQIYDAAKSSSSRSKPIFSPSMGWWIRSGSVAPLPFDKLSLHIYSNALHPGNTWLEREPLPYSAAMAAPGQSPQGTWVTETGYHNAIQSTDPLKIGLSETVTAKYIPRLFTLNFNRRIEKTFIYELIDMGTNLAYNEENFGIIRRDSTRKPVFWAIKNLIQLLKDAGTQSFNPGALNLSLTGGNSVNRTLLQKSDGDYYLLLWNEVPYNDFLTSVPVTVNFGSTAANVTVYSALSSQTYASQSHANIAGLSLAIPDEVIVLKISGITPAGTGAPESPSGPDLVVTKAWTLPAEPLAGEATKLFATVENRGTTATAASAVVTLRQNGDPNDHPLRFYIPTLAAGASISLEGKTGSTATAGTWSPTFAGRHNFSFTTDANKTVSEVNEANNGYLLTVPVPSARWIDPCDSLANWSLSPGGTWIAQTTGDKTSFANPAQHAGGTLTHVLPTPLTTDWHLDFEYSWQGGEASYDLSVVAEVLNNAGNGNGYQLRIHQGSFAQPTQPGARGRLIQLFKVTNGTAAARPLAEGPGYDLPGDPTGASFLPVRLIFDRSAQSCSVYIDANRDGVWEQSIAPVGDASSPVRDFHKIMLSAQDEKGEAARPKFDNIGVTRGMIDLAPAPYFTDPLNDLSKWTDIQNWGMASTGTYIRNNTSNAAGTLTHVFPNGLHGGWTVSFDYDFVWGGAASDTPLKWGAHNLHVKADMLDTFGNGYRVVVHQGDSNDRSLNARVIQIYRVSGGTETVLAEGVGYNSPGWQTLSRSRPDFKRIAFTYNRATQRLSVLADVNRDGVMEEVIAPLFDANHTSFNKLVLGAHDGQNAKTTPCLDNISVGLLGFTLVRQSTPYELWSASNTLSGSSAVEYVDPDGDGQPNLLEFALGSRPDRTDSINAPGVQIIEEGGQKYLSITVSKGPGRASADVPLAAEVSADLQEWFSGPSHIVVLEDSATLFRARDLQPISGSQRRFIRLSAGLPSAP